MCSTRRVVVLWLLLAIGLFACWFLRTKLKGPFRPPESIYLAGSNIPDELGLGGFGKWDNLPKDLAGQDWGEAGTISLIAFPSERASYLNLRGFAVRLVNRTEKPVAFTACDSRLYLVQEALDRNGKWRPIEMHPQSWCGNSYHRVFLDRDQYWEFPAPQYEGTFKTLLRFRLEQGEQLHDEVVIGEEKRTFIIAQSGGRVIYSNEFEGRINPLQFAAKTANRN